MTDKSLGYGSKGERLVAGVVPLNQARNKVLLIQSSTRKGWVLPKGGWELDEPTAAAAAQREAWEEAGITCQSIKDLGRIADPRTPTSSQDPPKASYQFFEVIVAEEKADWPEKAKRSRQWFGYADAYALLTQRPELLEALVKSSIAR